MLIPGVKPNVFSMLLAYMYLGSLNCPQDELKDLLHVAEMLKIK